MLIHAFVNVCRKQSLNQGIIFPDPLPKKCRSDRILRVIFKKIKMNITVYISANLGGPFGFVYGIQLLLNHRNIFYFLSIRHITMYCIYWRQLKNESKNPQQTVPPSIRRFNNVKLCGSKWISIAFSESSNFEFVYFVDN